MIQPFECMQQLPVCMTGVVCIFAASAKEPAFDTLRRQVVLSDAALHCRSQQAELQYSSVKYGHRSLQLVTEGNQKHSRSH